MRAALRRHERADVRHQRDQRHLAHVGRLAAHVRAGDQQQPARRREPAVVGDEVLDLRLDHRMAPALDLEADVVDELRPAVVSLRCNAAKTRTARRPARGRGRSPAAPSGRHRAAESSSSYSDFSSASARSRADSALSSKAFSSGRDVALGVLQRLPAPVVVGHLLRVRVGDLDVVAVHRVVGDAQVRDAGALPSLASPDRPGTRPRSICSARSSSSSAL